MAHTFDPANADRLDDVGRYRFCSRDELVALLDPDPGDVVLDVGSGTGFYSVDVAPHVERLVGLDVQPTMHELFRENGVPPNVELVTAEAADLPLGTATLDGVFSTMTFHEFAGTGAVDDLVRALRPGGLFVAVDWSAAGAGEEGPPMDGRWTVADAASSLEDAGLDVGVATERVETFALAASAPA